MKKSVMKRCIAMLLVAAMIFTSVDMNWSFTSKASDLQTSADFVADYYELTDAEKEILSSYVSVQVKGDEYQEITLPAENNADGIVAVDSVNEIIYAKDYTTPDGNYIWVPASAKVVGEYTDVEVDFERPESSVEYENETFESKAAFRLLEGGGYQVQVEYELYIDIDVDVQQTMFDTLEALEELYANAEVIKSSVELLDVVMTYVSVLAGNEDAMDMLEDIADDLNAFQSQLDANDDKCDLSALWKTKADSRYKHVLDNLEEYQEVIADTRLHAINIAESQNLSDLHDILVDNAEEGDPILFAVETLMTTFAEVAEALEPLTLGNNWAGMDSDMLDPNVSYKSFDAAVKALVEAEADRDFELEESLLVETAIVKCNVNSYDVTYVFRAEVYDENNQKLSLELVFTDNFPNGTVEKVQDKLEYYENAAYDEWMEYQVPYYYERYTAYEVEDLIEDVLTEDLEYVVSYTPVVCEFTYDGNTVEVYYGQSVTLPYSAVAGKSYTYTIDGVEYLEGESYRVLYHNVSATRELGPKKTNERLFEVVADQYKLELGETAVEILYNTAISIDSEDYPNNFVVTQPTSDSISIENGVITAEAQQAGDVLIWNASKAVVYKDKEVVETVEFTNGSAEITATDYTNVLVYYETYLMNVSEEEVLTALQTSSDLVEDANSKLEGMATLVAQKDNLSKVSLGTLNTLSGIIENSNEEFDDKEEVLKTVELLKNCCNTDGDLYIVAYANSYAELEGTEKQLDYYYKNAEGISRQITNLSKYLNDMLGDQGVVNLLAANGITSIEAVTDRVDELKDAFAANDIKVNIYDTDYSDLVALVAASLEKELPSFDEFEVDRVKLLSESISIPAEGFVQITVSVNGVSDVILWNESVAVNDTLLNAIEEMCNDMSAEYDAAYYEAKAEVVNNAGESKDLPKLGDMLTESLSVTYTWTPIEFRVHFDGGEMEEVTIEDRTINLPAPSNGDVRYVYTIGDDTVKVSYGESATYTMSEATFKQLFSAIVPYVHISRTEINVANEKANDLFVQMNNELIAAGLQNTMSFLPYQDAEGNMAVVLRVDALDTANLQTAFTTIVTILATNYVGIGGTEVPVKDFINGNIYMDALVEALLDSGFGTDALNAAINANGSINNYKLADGYTLLSVADNASEINTANVGGLLMEMTLSLKQGSTMPLYVTLQSGDTAKLSRLDTALNKADAYFDLELTGGAVEVEMTLPEKAHEAYLAAMLAEGKIDIRNFETPSLVDMVEYASDLTMEPLILSGEVNGETILNTFAELGVDADLSAYEATLTKIFSYANAVFEQEYIKALNEEEQADNLYKGQLYCPEAKMQAAVGKVAGSQMASFVNLIKGDIVVPMNTTLTNCDTEYTAAVIDINAEKIYNKVDLTTAKDITTKNDNAVVVLLDDVQNVTVNGKTYLNLNGNDVDKITANKAVTVADSRLSTYASEVGEISGNATVMAGTYGHVLSDDMLPYGYSQDSNGTVTNRYYTIVEDEAGNITIQIAADFMDLEDTVAWKTLALDMALDVAFDVYAWAGVEVKNNETSEVFDLYAVEVPDAIAAYKGGVKGLAEDIINGNLRKGEGFVAFANDLIAEFTDFGAISEAIANNEEIISYELTTKDWDVIVEVTDANYITAGLVTGDETKRTIEVVFVDETDGEDLEQLAELFAGLDEIVKITAAELEGSFEYCQESGFDYSASANLDVTVDLSQEPYAVAMAIIMGYGIGNNTDMKEAIQAYVDTHDTELIVAELETLTAAQIIKAFKKARGVEFTTMCKALGFDGAVDNVVELEAAYDDVLQLGYAIVTKLGLSGGNQKLVSCRTAYATYEINKSNWNGFETLHLKLILASTEKETYTVTWKNYNGKVLETDIVTYGTMPNYDGSTPTKVSTDKYTYTFKGWDKELAKVTADVTYTAQFTNTVRKYTVTWKNYDGTVLETDKNVKYGTMPTYDGETPVKPSTAKYEYTFKGWDKTVSKVTGNVTYTAQYKNTVRTYTIKWVNEDGKVLETDKNVKYGTMPTYNGKTPTKASTAKYEYTFKGWTPDVAKVTGNATYTAEYTKCKIKEVVVIGDVEISNKGPISGYSIDTDNKIIYLDVHTDGITHSEFNKYVEVNTKNADSVTFTFSDTTNKLVQTGETVKVAAKNSDSSKSVTYTVIILGDVVLNGGLGDGRIRSNDATVVLKHCVGKVKLRGNALRAAKINTTSGVDAGDATIILKKNVEKENYKTWLDN